MKDCKSCEYETLCVIPESLRSNINDCKVYEPKKKKTNADKIRAMSDEELAELFSEKCQIGIEFAKCWLQSEAE